MGEQIFFLNLKKKTNNKIFKLSYVNFSFQFKCTLHHASCLMPHAIARTSYMCQSVCVCTVKIWKSREIVWLSRFFFRSSIYSFYIGIGKKGKNTLLNSPLICIQIEFAVGVSSIRCFGFVSRQTTKAAFNGRYCVSNIFFYHQTILICTLIYPIWPRNKPVCSMQYAVHRTPNTLAFLNAMNAKRRNVRIFNLYVNIKLYAVYCILYMLMLNVFPNHDLTSNPFKLFASSTTHSFGRSISVKRSQ